MLKRHFIAITLLVSLCVNKIAAAPAAGTQPRVLFLTAIGPHSKSGKPFEHGVVKRNGGDLSLAERQLVNTAAGEFLVEPTQDTKLITPANLAKYAAVVSYTCGDPLKSEGRRALIDYVKNGGAFVGIHSAGDSFNTFQDYAEMLGGIHDHHPGNPKVRIVVLDKSSPATSHLPDSFETPHEPYAFTRWNPASLHLLLKLDPSSFTEQKDKPNRSDYAVAWTKTFGRGKVFYTALGHNDSEWTDAKFLQHVLGGIRWAVGIRSPLAPVASVPAATAPAETALVQTDANQARIEVLKEQGPNAVEWALAPLDQMVPGDIRQNLTFLREDLLDEGKQKPKASPAAYTLASQICNTLLTTLEERNQTLVRAGFRAVEAQTRTGVTSDALEARRNYKMSWPQFARENAQRAELKSQANAGAAVMAERPKVEWATRTAFLRKNLDTLYAQFREALRQSPAAK